ncbi:MAG: hypothetical protein JO057_31885 [Chloroflexi bacterium]|nr:hypothetical protein [Chloroflexota bacterium]
MDDEQMATFVLRVRLGQTALLAGTIMPFDQSPMTLAFNGWIDFMNAINALRVTPDSAPGSTSSSTQGPTDQPGV